ISLAELRQVLSHAPTTRLSTHIGGGQDGYCNVEGDGSRLTWRGPPEEREGVERIEVISIPPEAWEEFWQTLDRLEVWNWDGHRY
ncbi:hypothetical protein, partial [Pseudonocardia sp. EV170527-09]|uniref:hypothetical protein n=1 Tax=Pseudonocardia sp. EV170527-09 TaxID=2603411 RepID=UPI00196107CA